MATDLTERRQELLADLSKSLETTREIGLIDSGNFYTPESWFAKKDVLAKKIPTKLLSGQKCVVWAMPSDGPESGFQTARIYVVDEQSGRPVNSFRYTRDAEGKISAHPQSVRKYSYAVSEVSGYPRNGQSEIPFKVTEQRVEVFNCKPGTSRPLKRTCVILNDLIYLQNKTGDIFSPFIAISSSHFDLAPREYAKDLGRGDEKELWLERFRTFKYKETEVVYKNGDNVTNIELIKNTTSQPLSVEESFVGSLGRPREIILDSVEVSKAKK